MSFQAATRQKMLNLLFHHYMAEHQKIILTADSAKKKRWLERFDNDWKEAKEVR